MLQSTHIISPSGQTAMYITPKNLLHLSRLSKRFRSMFTSRSAIFIWKTAICNVDLDCYEDINEIQFASLLYDKFCMVTFSLSLSLFFFFSHHNMIYVSPLQACGRRGCKTYSMIRLRLCPIRETEK